MRAAVAAWARCRHDRDLTAVKDHAGQADREEHGVREAPASVSAGGIAGGGERHVRDADPGGDAAEQGPVLPHGRLSVLSLEDDPADAELQRRCLQKAGFVVTLDRV